jgi:hypothetical protein
MIETSVFIAIPPSIWRGRFIASLLLARDFADSRAFS